MGNKISGMKCRLYIVDASIEKVLAGQRGATLSRTADTIDVTSKDSPGLWRENLQGFKEWSVSGDGVYVTDDEAYAILRDRFLESQNVDVIVIYEDGNTESGNATISDFSTELPYDDAVTYSITLAGSGPLEAGSVMDV